MWLSFFSEKRVQFMGSMNWFQAEFLQIHLTSAPVIVQGAELIKTNDFGERWKMWLSAGLGAGLGILPLTTTDASTGGGIGLGQPPFISLQASVWPVLHHCWWSGGGFICFLPSWMNLSRVVLIFTLVEKGAQVSVLLSQGADLRRLARCVRSPKYSKVTTGENQCELFCAKRGGSDSRPAYVAFKVSKRKPGGSIPGVLGLRSCDWQGMPEELEPSAGNWMTGV